MQTQKNPRKNNIQTNNSPDRNMLIEQLHDIGAIQFGAFKLKSGITAPIYIDLRRIISYPHIMEQITKSMWHIIKHCKTDSICGIPYAGIPLAAGIALLYKKSMIMPRKEAKKYGNKKNIEGVYTYNNITLIIEDIMTTGSSIKETYETLKANHLQVHDVVVFCDRRTQNQKEKTPYTIHALYTLNDIVHHLYTKGKIDDHTYKSVQQFFAQ